MDPAKKWSQKLSTEELVRQVFRFCAVVDMIEHDLFIGQGVVAHKLVSLFVSFVHSGDLGI